MCYPVLEILTLQCGSRRNRTFHLPAVQPRSPVQFRKCHGLLWAGDAGGSDSLLQFQPHLHYPSLQFPLPLVFSSSSPSLHRVQEIPSLLSLLPWHTDVCTDLTSLTWLGLGRLLLTSLCRKLLPEAPRLTGIHSCSSATSSQSLSRKDFYSSHSWEQLPVRSETNKKTTLKATLNQITTELHTPGCWDPSAWLLTAPAQLKWHIGKASTSLCINQLRKLFHSL